MTPSAEPLSSISFAGTLGQRQFQIRALTYILLAALSATLRFSYSWADLGIALGAYLFVTAVVKRLRDGGSPTIFALLLGIPLLGWAVLAYYLSADSLTREAPNRVGKRGLSALAAFVAMSVFTIPITVVLMDRFYEVGQPSAEAPLATPPAPGLERQLEDKSNSPIDDDTFFPEALEEEPEFSGASVALIQSLESLVVEPEHWGGYDRDLFPHWVDEDRNGCDTRREVLIQESATPVTVSGGCVIENGTWLSPYDGTTSSNPSDFDIDHVVALKEAWESGAWQWDEQTRREFANDLRNPESLIAVSASSNRSKSASDPSDWLPSRLTYQCTYVASWVSIKNTWDLSVDSLEHETLQEILERC